MQTIYKRMTPLALGLALLPVPMLAKDFYVSPKGADTNPGTADAPFQTVIAARDAIRGLSASERSEDINVYLREGVYPINETLVFNVQDGGSEGAVVRYRAYQGEEPVLSSGVPVSSWQKLKEAPDALPDVARGKVWVANIPEGVDDFKVMFNGNQRLERARGKGFQGPEQSFKKFATRNVALPEDRPLLRRMEFPAGHLKAWDNIEDVEAFFCGVPWTHNISALESVDTENNIAWLKFEGNTPPSTTPKPYNPTHIENVIDVLDDPGEWCVNTKTGKIYYWPINGEPGTEIVVPTLTELVRVEGDIDYEGPVDAPVRNLEFHGLTFTHCDRYSWWDDHKGWGIQHDWDKFDHGNALLRFRGAEDCLVDSCHFVNSGNSAIRLDLHAQNIVIQNNLIERVGHMGILLCGYGPGTKDVNKGNRIVNNLIERTGEVIWHGHAIFVWQSGENTIANNMIRNVPRKAIGICGVRGAIFQQGPEVDWDEACKTIRWDELATTKFVKGEQTQEKILPYLHSRNNLIENNYVYRARTKIGDGAALNVSGAGTGNIMRQNMLYMSLGNGMRCDDWQNGTLFEKNLILSGGVVHKGKNDLVNNIYFNTRTNFSMYPDQQPNPGSLFERNIVYHTRAGIDPYTGRSSGSYSTPESCVLKENIYFATDGLDKMRQFIESKQAKGMEEGSILADPMFLNPPNLLKEIKPTDFELHPDSPALKLGFQQIAGTQIGLKSEYPAALRAKVEPSQQGKWISKSAEVSASSVNQKVSQDLQLLVSEREEQAIQFVYQSLAEPTPYVDLDLGELQQVNALYLLAHSNDRQNDMRALTVWTSEDGKSWQELWRADPYHIAMARDWRIIPGKPVDARYVRVGLRNRAELQMQPEDERIRSMRKGLLTLKSIQVYGQ